MFGPHGSDAGKTIRSSSATGLPSYSGHEGATTTRKSAAQRERPTSETAHSRLADLAQPQSVLERGRLQRRGLPGWSRVELSGQQPANREDSGESPRARFDGRGQDNGFRRYDLDERARRLKIGNWPGGSSCNIRTLCYTNRHEAR